MNRAILALTFLVLLVVVPALPSDAQEAPRDLKTMLLLLEETEVSIQFEEKPLDEVLKYFTDVTGVNLVVSPLLTADRDADELAVTLTLKKISVHGALQIILDLKRLAAVYRHGVIMITTPKDARGKPVLRMYDISDLTVRIRDFPAPDLMLKPSSAEDFGNIFQKEEEGREHAFADPEFIMDLVTDNTGSGTWEDEGVKVSVTERVLVVRTYPAVHRQIAMLLSLLRAFR